MNAVYATSLYLYIYIYKKTETEKHFSLRDSGLSLQQRLVHTPPLFVHTEPSSRTKRGVTVRIITLNMYQLTVHNHMDAVIKCCDRDPDPACFVESHKDAVADAVFWTVMWRGVSRRDRVACSDF